MCLVPGISASRLTALTSLRALDLFDEIKRSREVDYLRPLSLLTRLYALSNNLYQTHSRTCPRGYTCFLTYFLMHVRAVERSARKMSKSWKEWLLRCLILCNWATKSAFRALPCSSMLLPDYACVCVVRMCMRVRVRVPVMNMCVCVRVRVRVRV